jgi:hypothetical protein
MGGEKFTVTFQRNSDGSVQHQYGGNLSLQEVIANLVSLQFELMMQAYNRMHSKSALAIPGMLQPNMKRIPTEDVARRYRVA